MTDAYEGHRRDHHPDNWDLSTEMQRDFKEVTNQAERNESARAVQGALTDSSVRDSELNTQKIVDGSSKETMLRADTHFEKAQKQISDSATSTVVGFKDAQALAYQVQGQSLLEAAKNAAAASVQATSNFNLASVQATTIGYEAQLQAQVIAAAAAAKLHGLYR